MSKGDGDYHLHDMTPQSLEPVVDEEIAAARKIEARLAPMKYPEKPDASASQSLRINTACFYPGTQGRH